MKHFTMAEFTRSETARSHGIANEPSAQHRRNIAEFVETLLDPLREAWAVKCAVEHIGTPMLRVSSGYRSDALNRLVGGSATSAHSVGFAADLVPMNGRLLDFKRFCREWLAGRAYDQLISENENADGVPEWVHLGYKNRSGQQRGQRLSMRGGKYIQMTR